MTILSLGSLVFLFALQGPTPANDAKRLGRDDHDFARALSARGYHDLAQKILDSIGRQQGSSGGDPLATEVIRLDLLQAQAERTQDPFQAAKLLGEVVTAKEAFVKERSGTPAATEVLDGLPDLYRRVAERIAAAVDEGEPSAEKEELRQSGRQMFDRAVSAVQTQIETLKQRKLEEDPANRDPALQDEYMIATYNLARTRYWQGVLLGQGSDMQPLVLESALKVLEDFALDFSDQLICYEGYIYEGLCHKELQQPEKAIESFDAAISVREAFEQRGGVYQIDMPEAADIVSSGVLQKMLIQSETGDYAGAVATAEDFFATVPNPFDSLRGLAVLAEQAEAYKALGDDAAVETVANKLIQVDPTGPAGARGRELLRGGGGATLGASDTMKLAESAAARGELDRAVQLCQEVLLSARGDAQHDLGSRAGLLLGIMYFQKGNVHEAAVAWDTSAQRYSKGKDAPECMWRAVNGYITLQPDAPPYYKELVRDRMATLVKTFPQSSYASKAAIIEGAQLEAERKYAEAAAIYERVTPGSAAYDEAMFRAGNAWSRMAQAALKSGNAAEAKKAIEQAETKLKQTRANLEAEADKTLDLAQQERMRDNAFGARVGLANLYLVEGVDRPADALALFERVESEFPGDEGKIATAGNLRLRALMKLGKTEEATRLLDNLIAKDPEARGVGSGASTLARSLDTKAAELRSKDERSSEALGLWRKAATYYVIGVRGQLDGSEAMRVDDLEMIANRLFALALVLGDVPNDVQSFVDTTTTRPDPALLEQAVRIYEAVLPLTPSYRTQISLARGLGFLGRWQEAATIYAELFAQQRFANLGAQTIDGEALRAKPELIFALLEWGAAERELGERDSDNARKMRASSIFETMVSNTTPGSDLWWKSKYYQVRTMVDRGEYEMADIALNSLELNWPDYDGGKLRLAEKFRGMRQELKGRVFTGNQSK
jgi:tetratricopeptide (TPR) repeat protein